jgi:hypothetical protein
VRGQFPSPPIHALEQNDETRFITTGPVEELAAAIAWADIVWLEWCWGHAVWATRHALPSGKPRIVKLHSIEALQTAELLLDRFPLISGLCQSRSSKIVLRSPGSAQELDRFPIERVGHLEPEKNPMLLMQIAQRTQAAERWHGASRGADQVRLAGVGLLGASSCFCSARTRPP